MYMSKNSMCTVEIFLETKQGRCSQRYNSENELVIASSYLPPEVKARIKQNKCSFCTAW